MAADADVVAVDAVSARAGVELPGLAVSSRAPQFAIVAAVLAAAMPAISSVILAITIVGVFCLAVLFWSR